MSFDSPLLVFLAPAVALALGFAAWLGRGRRIRMARRWSPLLARTSAVRGTETISLALADMWNPIWNRSDAGFLTSSWMVLPSCEVLTSSAATASWVGPRFSISTSTSGLSQD